MLFACLQERHDRSGLRLRADIDVEHPVHGALHSGRKGGLAPESRCPVAEPGPGRKIDRIAAGLAALPARGTDQRHEPCRAALQRGRRKPVDRLADPLALGPGARKADAERIVELRAGCLAKHSEALLAKPLRPFVPGVRFRRVPEADIEQETVAVQKERLDVEPGLPVFRRQRRFPALRFGTGPAFRVRGAPGLDRRAHRLRHLPVPEPPCPFHQRPGAGRFAGIDARRPRAGFVPRRGLPEPLRLVDVPAAHEAPERGGDPRGDTPAARSLKLPAGFGQRLAVGQPGPMFGKFAHRPPALRRRPFQQRPVAAVSLRPAQEREPLLPLRNGLRVPAADLLDERPQVSGKRHVLRQQRRAGHDAGIALHADKVAALRFRPGNERAPVGLQTAQHGERRGGRAGRRVLPFAHRLQRRHA